MVTNTSIAPQQCLTRRGNGDNGIHSSSVYLFPDFKYLARVNPNEDVHLAYLAGAIRQSSNLASYSTISMKLEEIVVFICGHGSRDKRCGIMGPLLRSEFQRSLTEAGFRLPEPPAWTSVPRSDSLADMRPHNAIVGLVSHIGGHIWAGNVILYIPPTFPTAEGLSQLAGKGIWYGRVEPKHVEGIVKETILGGRVIKELFRGGINHRGESLRL